MRVQDDDWSCGLVAIQNALEVLQGRVSRRALLQACAANEDDGTPEDEIVRALLSLKFEVDVFESDVPAEAGRWVATSLAAGRPILVCVDRWSHWVTLIGVCGRRVLGFDPAGWSGWRAPADGFFVLRPADLRRRWEAAKRVRGRARRFYGIAIAAPTQRLLLPLSPA